MKRTQRPGSPLPERPKRAKTSEACAGCRRAKSRCEPNERTGRCHRCTVLYITCSFEANGTPRTNPPSPEAVAAQASTPLDVFTLPDTETTPEPAPDLSDYSIEDLVARMFDHTRSTAAEYPPMLLIHELMRRRSTNPVGNEGWGLPGAEIISEAQIRYMLSVFETHYAPWLQLPKRRHVAPSTPTLEDFTTLARCSVVCRHLPTEVFHAVQPRLQKLAEHAALVHVFNATRSPTLEAAVALVILTMWSPAIGSMRAEVTDGLQLVKGAAQMAVALGLDKVEERLKLLRHRGSHLTHEEHLEYEDLRYQAGCWNLICSAEWMWTIGTDTEPICAYTAPGLDFMNQRLFLGFGTVEDMRDFRIGIYLRLFEATRRGLKIRIKDLRTFSNEMESAMSFFRVARNWIMPLRSICEEDRIQTDMMLIIAYWNVLLLLYHGLAQVRAFMTAAAPDKPWVHALRESGVSTIIPWGHLAVNAAQTIISTFLDIVDRAQAQASSSKPANPPISHPLSALPDGIYAAVLYGTMLMVLTRYLVFVQSEEKQAAPWLTTGAMLGKLERVLDELALGGDHAPVRAARAVRELRRLWHEKVVVQIAPQVPSPAQEPGVPTHEVYLTPGSVSSVHTPESGLRNTLAPIVPPAPYAGGFGHMPFNGMPYGYDTGQTHAPAIGMGMIPGHGGFDDDFWTSFMGSMGTSTGV